MSRARQVANFDPALFAVDEVSGDKVSGGTIGAGVIGASVTGGAGLSGSTSLGTVTTGTISSGTVIDDPTMTQGSDATGDVYYRAAGGALTRLATGADGTVLTSTGVGAVPAFEAAAGGSASANDVVAFKSINWDADDTIAYAGTAFAEVSSDIRITHAMSDADNKLVFFFNSTDAYISSGHWGEVGVGKTTAVTTNIITGAAPLVYLKSGRGVEADAVVGWGEYLPGVTTSFTYTAIHKTDSGGNISLVNTTAHGVLRFSLMEIQQ